jgi:hypothetical protein
METIPNEVARMFFEHMNRPQRQALARVCKIWNFLMHTIWSKKLKTNTQIESSYYNCDEWYLDYPPLKHELTMLPGTNPHDSLCVSCDFNILHTINIWSRAFAAHRILQAIKIKILDLKNDILPSITNYLQINLYITAIQAKNVESAFDISKFFTILSQYPHVTTLKLCLSTEAQLREALQQLKNNKTIEHISLIMKDYTVPQNLLADPDTQSPLLACEFLSEDTTLKTLKISVDEQNAQHLTKCLAPNTCLTVLDLSNKRYKLTNRIKKHYFSLTGIQEMCIRLANNTTLKALDIRNTFGGNMLELTKAIPETNCEVVYKPLDATTNK